MLPPRLGTTLASCLSLREEERQGYGDTARQGVVAWRLQALHHRPQSRPLGGSGVREEAYGSPLKAEGQQGGRWGFFLSTTSCPSPTALRSRGPPFPHTNQTVCPDPVERAGGSPGRQGDHQIKTAARQRDSSPLPYIASAFVPPAQRSGSDHSGAPRQIGLGPTDTRLTMTPTNPIKQPEGPISQMRKLSQGAIKS